MCVHIDLAVFYAKSVRYKFFTNIAYRYLQSLSRCIPWHICHVQQSYAAKRLLPKLEVST